MFPYHRLTILFQYIKNHNYSNASVLAELVNVTQRSIRSDILVLNDILKDYSLSIENERGKGYFLKIGDNILYNEFLDSLSEDDKIDFSDCTQRSCYLIKQILSNKDWLAVQDLCDLIFVGKTTILKNLKEVDLICHKYDLKLEMQGAKEVRIFGSEQNKRKLIISEIIQPSHNQQTYTFTNREKNLFKDLDYELVRTLTNDFLKDNNFEANDCNRHNLILHICLALFRIKHDFAITSPNTIIIDNELARIVNPFFNALEKEFDCSINQNERNYLNSRFIANANINIHPLDKQRVIFLVDKTIELIQKYYSFNLSNDNILKEDLFHHYFSILSSNRFQINKRNPLLYTLKTNFALAFDVTLTSVSEAFNIININLSEDEIGYIALHIGAAIERCFSGNIAKKNVYIVTGNGNAAGRMLEARIHNYFKDKLQIKDILTISEYEELTNKQLDDIDFIITTSVINSSRVQTILVDLALSRNDVETISFEINRLSDKKYAQVKKYFKEECFMHLKSVNDKNELLKMMCDNLQAQACVNDEFFESILKRESLSNTAMNDKFALPHPMFLQAKKNCVGVAILDEAVKWSNEGSANIIFLLALHKEENLEIEHLYDLFIQIINNHDLENKIIGAKDFDEFMKILADAFKNLDNNSINL